MFTLFKYLCLVLFSSFTTISIQTYIDNKYSLEMRNKNIVLHDVRNLLPFIYNRRLKLFLEKLL